MIEIVSYVKTKKKEENSFPGEKGIFKCTDLACLKKWPTLGTGTLTIPQDKDETLKKPCKMYKDILQ